MIGERLIGNSIVLIGESLDFRGGWCGGKANPASEKRPFKRIGSPSTNVLFLIISLLQII